MTRILALGDVHLGALRESLGDERLRDQERVLDRIAELVEEERPDAVLFAGDAFEKRRPRPDEIDVWQRFVARVGSEACDFVGVPGNHDVEHADRVTALEVSSRIWMDVYREPAICRGPGIDFAVLPWCPVSRLVAQQGGGDRDGVHARAAELLVDVARGLRAECGEGPAVLLGHWSVSGSSLPSGLPVDQLREVVLPVGDLEAMGWDAVVLGHIHRGGVFAQDTLYVGSPMPLNFGEASVTHGVYVLDTEDVGNHQLGVFDYRFLPIESRPFATIDLDATNDTYDSAADFDELLDPGFAGYPQLANDPIVRLRYRATEEQARRIDHGKLRDALLRDGAYRVAAIQPEIVREARARVAGVDEQLGELDALRLFCEAQEIPDERAGRMAARTSSYLAEATA